MEDRTKTFRCFIRKNTSYLRLVLEVFGLYDGDGCG